MWWIFTIPQFYFDIQAGIPLFLSKSLISTIYTIYHCILREFISKYPLNQYISIKPSLSPTQEMNAILHDHHDNHWLYHIIYLNLILVQFSLLAAFWKVKWSFKRYWYYQVVSVEHSQKLYLIPTTSVSKSKPFNISITLLSASTAGLLEFSLPFQQTLHITKQTPYFTIL